MDKVSRNAESKTSTKRSQEADMQLNREKYEQLVSLTLGHNEKRAKIFLAVDGLRSRKEIESEVEVSQPTVWRALDHLESYGLVIKLETSKTGSPVYGKPRWIHVLRIDDYVRSQFSIEQES